MHVYEIRFFHFLLDIKYLMAYSRDFYELQYIWEAWRIETGNKMKKMFPEYVRLLNKAAQLNGIQTYNQYNYKFVISLV